jgi:hypothetical protein
VALRLKFLRKDYDLKGVKARVWTAEKSFEKNLSLSQLLYIYLEQTHRLYVRWSQLNFGKVQEYVEYFNAIQTFCNEQVQALKKEHGGSVPTFVQLTLTPQPLILF